MNRETKFKILAVIYGILAFLFTLYSYAFLDVGLTLTSFEPYLRFQREMRWFGYFERPKSALSLSILFLLIGGFYWLLIGFFKKNKFPLNKIVLLAGIISIILVFAYPAFSHDIFNYIFNAKMVIVYGADPHKHVAMEFPDPMLGFMRNIHTAAPYFYGWTIISLIPFLFGFNRIFPEIISFKLFSLLFFFLTFLILKKIYSKTKIKNSKLRLTLFLLNPLVLIEAIGVGHNDFSMMVLALACFYLLLKAKEEKEGKKRLKFVFLAFVLILFSVSIKYATIVLIPLLLLWYLKPKFDIGFWGGMVLFLIQFSRFGLMHSWYFIWPLTWSLLSKNMRLIWFFVLLSFCALLRYIPYAYYGNWDPPVPLWRGLIYFLIPAVLSPFFLFSKYFKKKIISYK